MAELRLQYWDAPLFISYLTGTDAERVTTMRKLIDYLDKGEIRVVVSTFLLAEVRHFRVEGAPGPEDGREGSEPRGTYDEARLREITNLLDSDRLDWRVLTPFIGRAAAAVGNRFPSLMPADCVHIATAQAADVDVLMTYDGAGDRGRRRPREMIRYDGRIDGLMIRAPWDPWPSFGL